jgi:hypothetical protein
VKLDGIKACLHRTGGCSREIKNQLLEISSGHLGGHRHVAKRLSARSHGLPGALSVSKAGGSLVPGNPGRGLPAGVSELKCNTGALGVQEVKDFRPRVPLLVIPDTSIARGDAPLWADSRSLRNDEARSSGSEGSEVNVVPLVHYAIDR